MRALFCTECSWAISAWCLLAHACFSVSSAVELSPRVACQPTRALACSFALSAIELFAAGCWTLMNTYAISPLRVMFHIVSRVRQRFIVAKLLSYAILNSRVILFAHRGLDKSHLHDARYMCTVYAVQ